MRSIIAADVMTPTILKVGEETTLAELANFLIEHEITGAVVTNDEETPLGVVSFTDIAAATALSGESLESKESRRGFYSEGWADTFDETDLVGMHVANRDLTAGDIMTPELYSVAVDMPVPEVARLMCDSHLHRVLVTAEGDFVGIITTSDLLGLLVDEKG
jgi:CBS domain-containing protein